MVLSLARKWVKKRYLAKSYNYLNKLSSYKIGLSKFQFNITESI